MKKNIILCVTGAIALTWGAMNFELGGIDSTTLAITVSMSIVLGVVLFSYGVYALFQGRNGRNKTKPTAKKGEKPMAKTKEKASTSVTLMKREKELETRRKELESLLAEVTKEEKAVEKQLLDKGWVQKDGSWSIK